MTELFDAIASPWNLAWVLLVFGFAPGFVLRLLVKLYPKNDPRRAELVAELYAVPRLQRPLWVAEQIEVAIFEGPRQRRLDRSRRRRGKIERRRDKIERRRLLTSGAVAVAAGALGASGATALTNGGDSGPYFWQVLLILVLSGAMTVGVVLVIRAQRDESPKTRRSRFWRS